MTEPRWNEVRPVKEWIGAKIDSVPPPSVRLRVFRDHGGICHRSKVKIRPGDKWALDHVKAIIDGGENRESNLAPILHGKGSPHSAKTAEEQRRKAKADAQAMKAFGIKKPGRSLSHPTLVRGFDGVVRER